RARHSALCTFGCSFFFFFQAEDGIRDSSVTGVQTCALPIYNHRACRTSLLRLPSSATLPTQERSTSRSMIMRGWGEALPCLRPRSEERRVGKECRCGCTRDRQETCERDGGR